MKRRQTQQKTASKKAVIFLARNGETFLQATIERRIKAAKLSDTIDAISVIQNVTTEKKVGLFPGIVAYTANDDIKIEI